MVNGRLMRVLGTAFTDYDRCGGEGKGKNVRRGTFHNFDKSAALTSRGGAGMIASGERRIKERK